MLDHTSRPNRRQALQSAGAAALGLMFSPLASRLTWAADADRTSAGAKKRVLFFTKSSGFQHSVITRTKGPDELSYAEQILTELGSEHGFEVTCSKDGSVFTPENMAGFDAFVFYTTGNLTTAGTDKTTPMTAEGKAAFLQAIRDGKGFIGLHSASDTFHSPGPRKGELIRGEGEAEKVELDPYIEMLGGEFIVHGAQQKAAVKVIDPKFPGAPEQGWEMTEEWYSLKNFAPDMHVILLQETQGMKGDMYQRRPFPETWARMHGKGRVFYSSMGHREDVWKNDQFVNLLVGGMNWVTGRADADVTPNFDKVAPGAEPPRKDAK